ncbi:MAG: sugar nucleotide-binding protein, partial [Planctomycetales bacterium]|nr:sugar nucleotide-binding protein [Planctomycetales bacterium]
VGPGIVACDAEDDRGLAELFAQYQFRGVLNCAGNCALKACEVAPEIAWRINRDGVANLVRRVAEANARLVHLSIDLVFSGRAGRPLTENDSPDPVTQYGKSMVAAEELVLAKAPGACILRISLPMGVSFNGHAGAIDWIAARFRKGRPATLYFDEIRTPTYTDCLNSVCETVLARPDLTGVYHAGAPRALSLFQIAQVVNRLGGFDADDLLGCHRLEAGPIPPRAGNVAMNSSKLAAALGRQPFAPWPLHDDWTPTGRGWHYIRNGNETRGEHQINASLYCNPAADAPRPWDVDGFPLPKSSSQA